MEITIREIVILVLLLSPTPVLAGSIDGGSAEPRTRTPSKDRTNGDNAAKFGCAMHAIAGHYFGSNTPACGEQPYNADVNAMIEERIKRNSDFDMNGGGVLAPSEPISDSFNTPLTPLAPNANF